MPPEYIQRLSKVPFIVCIVVTLALGHAYRAVRWSFVDTSVNLSAAADTRSWSELVSDSLTKSVEYRPLLDVGTRVAYRLAGLNLGTYKVLVLVEFALILLLLASIFQATGWRRVTASVLALSIVVGLHTSGILFLFVPLNAYAAAMLIVLAVTRLTLTPRFRAYEWTLMPLTLIALLWLEIGAFIVPIVAVARLLKAPGSTWRGVTYASAGLAVYLVARLGFSPGGVPYDSPETGLGFSSISADEAATIFARAPWLLWLYNVGSTLMTVLASEPRAGRFQFVESLLRGNVPAWMWIHIVSSVATTAAMALGLTRIGSWPPRDRVIAAFGGVLVIGGSVLSFLYTRDRIGLPVGVGYAMLAYVTLSSFLERRGPRWQTISVAVLVAFLGACWLTRAAEKYVSLRDMAWDYHLEWDRGSAEEAVKTSPIVARMRAAALKRVPADARRDPAWTYKVFERRYEPAGQSR